MARAKTDEDKSGKATGEGRPGSEPAAGRPARRARGDHAAAGGGPGPAHEHDPRLEVHHHEARHMQGVSIAVKLALVTAGLVAVFMVGFGVFLRGVVREALQQQILLAAYEAAWVGAHTDAEAWTEYFGTQFQGLTPEQITERASAMSPKEYDAAFRSQAFADRKRWNSERLARLVPNERLGRIMAAEVFVQEGEKRRLIASYGTSMSFSPRLGTEAMDFGRGSAQEGVLELEGKSFHVIRGGCPIFAPDGQTTGEFGVYISASVVDEAVARITAQVAFTGGLLVLVGAITAWAAGRWLVRPVKQLQEDMRIVAAGDLAHKTHAVWRDEIGDLARNFDLLTHELASAAQRERESAASRHQMSVAGEVTASLFPAKLPDVAGWDLAGHHEASGQLTGEIYDVLPMPGGKLGLLVASASGSGVPAAMVMAMARSSLAAVARDHSDPGAILRQVNALLSGDLRRGMYVTVLMAVLDPATGELRVANAGHAPLLVRKAASGRAAPVHSEGIALGFDKGPVFDSTLRVVKLTLSAGDRVMLYTPGVTRVGDGEGAELGEARFAALFQREGGHTAPDLVRRMAALLRKFRGEHPLAEDVTLLALGRQA